MVHIASKRYKFDAFQYDHYLTVLLDFQLRCFWRFPNTVNLAFLAKVCELRYTVTCANTLTCAIQLRNITFLTVGKLTEFFFGFREFMDTYLSSSCWLCLRVY